MNLTVYDKDTKYLEEMKNLRIGYFTYRLMTLLSLQKTDFPNVISKR